MYSIATLAEIKQAITSNPARETTDADKEAQLLDMARDTAQEMEYYCDLPFVPRQATRKYSIIDRRLVIDDAYNTLSVRYPIVELKEVAIGGETETLSDYRLLDDRTPSFEIQRKRDTGIWTVDDYDERISITAIEVMHPDYDNAWSATDTVQDSPLSSSATTVTVSDASQFSPGMVLRIEDEYLILTDTDTGANTLTVLRGERGTSASEHTNGTTIDVYKPPRDILRAHELLTEFNVGNIANYTRISIEGGQAQETIEIPQRVQRVLDRYRRKLVKGF